MSHLRRLLLAVLCLGGSPFVCNDSFGQGQALFAQVLQTENHPSSLGSVWTEQQFESIRRADSTDQLIELLGQLIVAGELPAASNPAASLEGVTWVPTGWRWEQIVDRKRIILAIEEGHLFALRVNHAGRIEMSIGELRSNQRTPGGLLTPNRAVYPHKQIRAMSETHLSRIAPEVHQLYAYFAGPSRTIVRSSALSTPTWANLSRGTQSY